MNMIIEQSAVTALTKKELMEINGGEPTTNTSFAYDVSYVAAWVLWKLMEGASHIKG